MDTNLRDWIQIWENSRACFCDGHWLEGDRNFGFDTTAMTQEARVCNSHPGSDLCRAGQDRGSRGFHRQRNSEHADLHPYVQHPLVCHVLQQVLWSCSFDSNLALVSFAPQGCYLRSLNNMFSTSIELCRPKEYEILSCWTTVSNWVQ